ncbi:hypothetical protein [Amycolatopsis sacchari]|uniref:hypothetical protein n=1 Tax=Amycolatopsis sacchari TaxID=115433 RepID=UPI003D73162C
MNLGKINIQRCPSWCARGQEHCGPDDTEHWSEEIDLLGAMNVSIVVDHGSRTQYEIRSDDYFTVRLSDMDVVDLIKALTDLMLKDLHYGDKRVVLEH